MASGAGSGDPQEIQTTNTDPNTRVVIPANKLEIMRNVMKRYTNRLTPLQIESIIENSHREYPDYTGSLIYGNLGERAEKKLAQWEPDDYFWSKLSTLIDTSDNLELLKRLYLIAKKENSYDYTKAKELFKLLALDQQISLSDIRAFNNETIGELIMKIYNKKKRSGIKFANIKVGGKSRKSGKSRKLKSRKSGKSRKGKGKGRK